ncbi:MAG TPA: S-adenosylmethionine:tRNA ribosyltransferase-isomerase [Blastocatellia bacterium]|nr:S-adenosylmethionine:tRNA ribosyltransferase-isomerase [Blastocatellia bacterium]HMV84181.1 S-adenosylmethionine:tRNA ribosyltransferase-isomerase [Blastocatellia bacterium]HMX28829.1 S-adenosylmethionine:tRNA ribosyltransferase-isomerase [Blastocatellia bacterium]HMY71110.1 S-adenosylmethionine:tRNA ribosyltransferase-isomerase [Blastocatellia bacterium]HMZ19683.1 S-adenosylmethionine:tRNA ribosyltransferase-isomerase [Blastocatellia bacterium]
MKAARSPRSEKKSVKLLVIAAGKVQDSAMARLPEHLRAGDLLVVNDAATLPASLHGRDAQDNPVEIRLASQLNDRSWQAVIFGAGDWHLPTEDRPAPPRLKPGEEIAFADDFRAVVRSESRLSGRLLELQFNHSGEDLWRGIYRYGKPVQYSYMTAELNLWSVQNVYGSRPWAVEMPSAGHALNWRLLLKLREKGIRIATLTHGAGLSATGDAALDQALPLAERYEIPAATMDAVRQTKANGGRVVAVGTSVVRALESSPLGLRGVTELKIGPEHKLQFVDGLLSGTHDVTESHYRLLLAFLPEALLGEISRHLEAQNYLTHEFGDACLIV